LGEKDFGQTRKKKRCRRSKN